MWRAHRRAAGAHSVWRLRCQRDRREAVPTRAVRQAHTADRATAASGTGGGGFGRVEDGCRLGVARPCGAAAVAAAASGRRHTAPRAGGSAALRVRRNCWIQANGRPGVADAWMCGRQRYGRRDRAEQSASGTEGARGRRGRGVRGAMHAERVRTVHNLL